MKLTKLKKNRRKGLSKKGGASTRYSRIRDIFSNYYFYVCENAARAAKLSPYISEWDCTEEY